MENYIPGYKNLNVYKKADELAVATYTATKNFPREELFGLTSQIRRCAVSVPANIVEGYGRKTNKDKKQFYYIARGSLNELEYYLGLSKTLGYLTESQLEALYELRNDTGRLLTGFIKSLQ